jgi:phosphatidylinositol-3-phosphatase
VCLHSGEEFMRLLALGLVLLGTLSWAAVAQSQHVWIITEENHSYESVVGNPKMPYFNSLARKYGLAKQYYAEQHNSLSALMWLVAGQPITGNNQTTACYNVDNIARHLIAKGLTWRSYQEDLPYPGFTGLKNLDYVRRHNPIIDFTDTCDPKQALNSVPFTRLAKDIANHATPNYAYITPNLQNDAHDGTLAAADYWLSQHVPTILRLPEFQPGGDGIMFIVWDEADLSSDGTSPDDRCAARIAKGCGGRLATLVIGPQVKPGYASPHRYDHANLLRTVCDAVGFTSCPGAAAVASPMADFFNTVEISTPFPNTKVASPVHIRAEALNDSPVIAMQVYVDHVLRYRISADSLSAKIPMSLGDHHVTVQSWDAAGGIHKRSLDVNVQSQAVMVTDPPPNAVVSSSVPVSAVGTGSKAITKMQLYIDGNAHFQSSGNTLNTKISLSPGPHNLAVEATDSSGNLTRSKIPVTAASPSVQILSPEPNSSLYAPLYVSAKTIDPTPITVVQIYVDHALAYQFRGTGVQARLPMSVGTHSVVVKAWNASGASYKRSVTVNIVPVPITISSPVANATVTSPVKVTASVAANSPVKKMNIYIDHVLKYKSPGTSVSHSFTLSSGQHHIVVKGWDQYGNSWSKGRYVKVK